MAGFVDYLRMLTGWWSNRVLTIIAMTGESITQPSLSDESIAYSQLTNESVEVAT